MSGSLMLWSMVLTGVLLVAGSGCGDDDSNTGTGNCVSLCQEAQAGKCTAIKGDCTAFCSALDNVKGPANCATQKDDYQICLNAKSSVCASSCGSQESALTKCVGIYCLLSTDADCTTLKSSF